MKMAKKQTYDKGSGQLQHLLSMVQQQLNGQAFKMGHHDHLDSRRLDVLPVARADVLQVPD